MVNIKFRQIEAMLQWVAAHNGQIAPPDWCSFCLGVRVPSLRLTASATAAADHPILSMHRRMSFTLPDLPYDYAALEPFIDAQTMQIHHE